MAATLYTGNASTNVISNAVNGVSFQPDLAWIKIRSSAGSNVLTDSIRGTNYQLASDTTAAESFSGFYITSLNSNGFSLYSSTGSPVNNNGSTYVAWQWNAGGSTVTNTSGSISAQVRANPTAGFSVVTYTGNGSSSATVGHGLGVVPAMVITKGRSGATEWMAKHQSLPTGQNLVLNQTLAASSSLSFSQGVIANLTSSTTFGFTAGSSGVNNSNQNGVTYVAYCFAQVAGYSAFGSYTGNGSADGPFVFTGFRPRWVMIKRTDGTADWIILDTSRDTYNMEINYLIPNTSGAEASGSSIQLDGVSNGIKIRGTWAGMNASGGTYIYAAFAENPFKNSLAR
jgi:hypothetical protein